MSDYQFIPWQKIKDRVQLVTAIHEINPLQQMALMTADPNEARKAARRLAPPATAAEGLQGRASDMAAATHRPAT
jgi:hypothetical protein